MRHRLLFEAIGNLIKAEFTDPGQQRAVSKLLKERSAKVNSLVARVMTELMLRLQQHIQRDKLQGQVLKHRSGKLTGSIIAHPATVSGHVITASVTGAGGPAWYGRIHEEGGRKTYVIYPTNKLALRWLVGGKPRFAAYVFHPPLPKRPFMAPSLEDMRAEIVSRIKDAAVTALRGES